MRDKDVINTIETGHGIAKSAGRKIVPKAVHPHKPMIVQ